MSGMAHGVEVSFGKVMVIEVGAGLVPSVASSSDQSPSAGGVQLYFSSPLAFSVLTQRSEPAGEGAVASPSACVNCSALPSSETPETVLCAVLPTQASTSSGRPAASIKLPSPLTVIVTVPSRMRAELLVKNGQRRGGGTCGCGGGHGLGRSPECLLADSGQQCQEAEQH